MIALGEEKDRSLSKITANPVCRYFIEWSIFPSPALATARIAALWVISNSAVMLATVSATIPVLFSDGTQSSRALRAEHCIVGILHNTAI